MRIYLDFNCLIRQLKFVFLFVIWSYCFLRISHNTLSTTWVSLTEGFYHPRGLTNWWFHITMLPGWWIMHLVIIIYIPLLLNSNFQSIIKEKNYKIVNSFFWIVFVPLFVIFF
jgi:hypothetical protein